MPEIQKLVIIGSGPAGLTAGIYAARAGLEPIIYEGHEPGGQLMGTTKVENYPGFPNGILGPELMMNFKSHAQNMGVKVISGVVTSVDFSCYPYKIIVDNNDLVYAYSVIISTGATAKWLGLESEKRLNGKGVSACAVCDGFFFKGQKVVVVGGGDSAAEQALYLSNICSEVTVLVRSNHMRASDVMQRRINNKLNINIIYNSVVKEILGDDEVVGIEIMRLDNDNTVNSFEVNGVFIAIGHTPNTFIFKDYLDLDVNGYIKTVTGTTITSLKGVFAAGDVQDSIYRQAITSAGSGCMAALDAEKFLSDITF